MCAQVVEEQTGWVRVTRLYFMNEDAGKVLAHLEIAVGAVQASDSEPFFLAKMVQLWGRTLAWPSQVPTVGSLASAASPGPHWGWRLVRNGV